MNFLFDLAKAHEKHEGYYPPGTPGFPKGSLSFRNMNPGNLRLTKYQQRVYSAIRGEGNFAKFPSYEIGLKALMDDLKAKIMGNSAHINYSSSPTFLTYVSVYAPSRDHNDPVSYAKSLITLLPQYHLRLDMPLTEMGKLLVEHDGTKFDVSRLLQRFLSRAKGMRLRRLSAYQRPKKQRVS